MSTAQSTPFTVPDIFRNLDADVVVVSSDNVQFRVYKLLLKMGSVVFRNMFEMPQPATVSSPDTETVPWPETAVNITQLLYYIYPQPKPKPKSLDNVLAFMEAAFKWQIDVAIAELRKELVSPAYLDQRPLRVYSFSCEKALDAEKQIAALRATSQDIWDPALRHELGVMSAIDLLRLNPGYKLKEIEQSLTRISDTLRVIPPTHWSAPPAIVIPAKFRNPQADLIVQSRDRVEFRVHSIILAEASPLLKKEPNAIFQWDEDANVILDLLLYIYPSVRPRAERSLDKVLNLLRAAIRWKLEGALSDLREELVSPRLFTTENSFRIYGFACQFGLQEERKAASSKAIQMDVRNHKNASDFYGMTAVQLQELVNLRQRRVKAAKEAIEAWKYPASEFRCSQCTYGRGDDGSSFKSKVGSQIDSDATLDISKDLTLQEYFAVARYVCPACLRGSESQRSQRASKLSELQATLAALPDRI